MITVAFPETRDKRYLKATTTDRGFAQANQAIVNLLDYLQEKKIKSTYLTDMKILNMQYISDTKIKLLLTKTGRKNILIIVFPELLVEIYMSLCFLWDSADPLCEVFTIR